MARFFSSLRFKLILLVLLAVIPAFAGITYASLQERRQDALQAEQQALLMAMISSSTFSELASAAEQLLGTLAELQEVRNGDIAATDALFRRLLKQYPIYSIIGALDARGNLYSSSLPESGTVNAADRAYFQRAVRARGFAIGDFIIGRLTGTSAVTFAYAVLDQPGNVQSVLFAGMDVARLTQLDPTVSLPTGTIVTIVDDTGTVLARYPDPDRLVGRVMVEAPMARKVLGRKAAGTVAAAGFDGVKRLYGFVPLQGTSGGPYVIVGIPEGTAFAAANQGFQRNIIILLLSLLTALGLALAITSLGVMRPVSRLIAITRRIADGDLEARTGFSGDKSELGELARAFDDMGRQIAQRQAEQKRAEEEINNLNMSLSHRALELEASNTELEAFSYSVSHDLRAPLRSMAGFSQALLEDYRSQLDEQGKSYLMRIQESSDLMAKLIDDLLELSRVTRTEMRREPVDLSLMAQTILAELQKAEPQRRVEYIIAPGLVAQGDSRLIRLMLENLLENAWKFTGKAASPRIEVGVTDHDGEPTYFVRDNGTGFNMAYAAKLFLPFQRLHKTSEFPGTGIGLATVQRIIARHGGRVWAEGEVDQGTTFYFTIS